MLAYQLHNFNLNILVDLVTPHSFTISTKFAFFLNFSKTLPYWYANQIIFLFLLLIISSNSQITAAASSVFSTLLAFSFNSVLMLFTIDDQLIKFLSYFFFRFLQFIAAVRSTFKILHLKLKDKVEKALK